MLAAGVLYAGLTEQLVKFVQRAVRLLTHVLATNGDDTIVGILSMVDISFMASVVVIVTSACDSAMIRPLMLACRSPNLPPRQASMR